jgi:hypothetical protein
MRCRSRPALTARFFQSWSARSACPGSCWTTRDFTAIAHTSVQNVGGKGFGSGQKQQQTTTYTYTAAVMLGLCMGKLGPELVKGVGQIWDSKGKYSINANSESFTLGGTPYHYTPTNAATFHDDRGAAVSTSNECLGA